MKLALMAGFAGAVAAVFLNSSAYGDFNVPDAVPGQVETVAIDTVTTGNTATSVASVESSRTRQVGQTFPVDVVVDEVHPGDKLWAIGMEVGYNPSVLRVTAWDPWNFLLYSDGQDTPLVTADPLPDSDGSFRLDAIDMVFNSSDLSDGEGVLVRLTLECVQAGSSQLSMSDANTGGGSDPGLIRPPGDSFTPIAVVNNVPATINCSTPVGVPGQVETVAIDTITTSNTATSVPSVQSSRTQQVGYTFPVDVVVDEIHPSDKLFAMGMEIGYNPSVLRVTAANPNFLLYSDPPNVPLVVFDALPDSSGSFRLDAADMSLNSWSDGEGVLVRLTLECVQPGTSQLSMTDSSTGGGSDPGLIRQDLSTNIAVVNNVPATINCVSHSVGGVVDLAVEGRDSGGGPWYAAPTLTAMALLGAAATWLFVKRRRASEIAPRN